MKKYFIIFVFLYMLLPLSVGASSTGTVYCPDDNEPLNIRDKVGGTNVLTAAACGANLEILNNNAGSTVNCTKWFQVKYNGTTGYACGNYIKENTEKAYVMCIENDDPLTFRDSVGGNILERLPCDTEVDVLDKNAGSNSWCSKWYKIRYNNRDGYGCGNYLSPTKTGSSSSNNNSGGSTSSTSVPTVGVSSSADNIYLKDNYKNKVNGDGTIACYEDTSDASLRSSAGSGTKVGSAKCGDVVRINSSVEGSGNCGYYLNVTNQRNETGYICGYYVNSLKLTTFAENYYSSNGTKTSYTNELKNKGFPDSYITYLLEIHARHPKWKFTKESININFDNVVNNEAYTGRNLLEGAAFNQNYLSMGINSYNILSNSFIANADEPGYYDASTEAIAYYMDPRTYLNEKYIFAFETLHYSSSHTENMVTSILSSQSFWPTVYRNYSGTIYSDIMNVTRNIDVSSVHIASRIKQEITGISTSDPRLGGSFTAIDDNKTYSGYYNFFNIGVWGTNKVARGMTLAKNNGWNTPYKAVLGGSQFIRDDYVSINQDTVYYEKFDVSTTNGHYEHQYMQNLAAPIQETSITYSSYRNLSNYFDREIEFIIPVYNNMSNYHVTAPRLGNPNNYLKNLTVNGKTISGFSYDTTDYTITVAADVNSVSIGATKIASGASITGTGTINVGGNTSTSVKVTAENGRVRTYNITIKKSSVNSSDDVAMSTILNKSGAKYNGSFMYGIKENSSINDFINNIKKVSSTASVNVRDKNGNPKSGVFKTGDTVTISNLTETKTFSIVIYGDINGDSKINKDDCLAILRHINGYTKLKNAFKEAGDANHDGKINKDDCLAILRHLNGYTRLN